MSLKEEDIECLNQLGEGHNRGILTQVHRRGRLGEVAQTFALGGIRVGLNQSAQIALRMLSQNKVDKGQKQSPLSRIENRMKLESLMKGVLGGDFGIFGKACEEDEIG